MLHITPAYYSKFQCIASRCSDNCCIGWEIDIDQAAADRYRNLPGSFGEKLRNSIYWEDPPHFILEKDGRCPLLDGENLCKIYQECGQNALCEICAEHPRFHEWFGSRIESGIGMCCEAAAELILFEKPDFCSGQDDQPDGKAEDQPLLDALTAARETAFSLVLREEFPYSHRLLLLLELGAEVQDCLDYEDLDGVNSCAADYRSEIYCREVLDSLQIPKDSAAHATEKLFRTLSQPEPNRPDWPEKLRTLFTGLPAGLSPENQLPTQNATLYFLFRYLLKSVFDGEILARMRVCVLFGWLLSRFWEQLSQTGTCSRKNQISAAKNFSRELEYNESFLLELTESLSGQDFLTNGEFYAMILR